MLTKWFYPPAANAVEKFELKASKPAGDMEKVA
jgi:hypothetical protein